MASEMYSRLTYLAAQQYANARVRGACTKCTEAIGVDVSVCFEGGVMVTPGVLYMGSAVTVFSFDCSAGMQDGYDVCDGPIHVHSECCCVHYCNARCAELGTRISGRIYTYTM